MPARPIPPKIAIIFSAAIASSILVSPLRAASEGDPLSEALADVARHEAAGFAFTRKVHVIAEDERVDRTERYDPSRPPGERWQLLEVEGRPPDAADLADYDGGDGDPLPRYAGVIGDIDRADATLIGQESTRLRYRLEKTKAGFLQGRGEAFADHLVTTVTVETDSPTPYVAQLEITAPESFEPAIAAKITDFVTRFTFAPHKRGETILPREIVVEVEGAAFLFASFGAKTRVRYSDYERVATEG